MVRSVLSIALLVWVNNAVAFAGTGTLVVDSTPTGALALLDGGEVGHTPLRIEVDLGDAAGRTSTLVLRMEAYNDREEEVALTAGETTDLGLWTLVSPHPLPHGARPLPDQETGVMEAGYAVETPDGAVMVWAPAGPFAAGYPEDYPDPRAQDMNPARTVDLDGFWIDRFEVTNRLYARFCAETQYDPPDHWEGGAPPEGEEDEPVVFVTFEDADAYARWARKRLPTEDQWEKAARGADDARLYPWGDEFTRGDANFSRLHGEAVPVGSFAKDASPYGVMDMAGNVREWVLGEWAAYPGAYILRGGSFGKSEASENPEFAMIPFRGWVAPEYVKRYWHLTGFRCVVN